MEIIQLCLLFVSFAIVFYAKNTDYTVDWNVMLFQIPILFIFLGVKKFKREKIITFGLITAIVLFFIGTSSMGFSEITLCFLAPWILFFLCVKFPDF